MYRDLTLISVYTSPTIEVGNLGCNFFPQFTTGKYDLGGIHLAIYKSETGIFEFPTTREGTIIPHLGIHFEK
jgi:hypothetical protein